MLDPSPIEQRYRSQLLASLHIHALETLACIEQRLAKLERRYRSNPSEGLAHAVAQARVERIRAERAIRAIRSIASN